MKWFAEKSERVKQLAVLLLVLSITGGLVLNITGSILKSLKKTKLPEGEIQELMRSMPDLEIDYPAIYRSCPTYPYQIKVPEGTEQKDGILSGVKNGITYLIVETSGSLDELMRDTLPRAVSQPVLGYVPKYEEGISKDGYLYDKRASYQVGLVQTKISVRYVTAYTCAYMLYLDKGMKLVLYASTQDIGLMEEAEELIRQMAVSMELYSVVTEEKRAGSGMDEIHTTEELDFTIDVKNDFFLTNGICVLHWTNVSITPRNMALLEDGKELSFIEEKYSVPGEYVFFIGEGEPKTYQICGTVEEPLYNVWANFQELEDYIGYRESEENPEFWIPRNPD